LLFLTTIAAVVFGVRTLLNHQKTGAQSNILKSEPFLPILPESSQPPKSPEVPEQFITPTLPVPAPAQPSINEPPQPLPGDLEPTTPGMVATELLEKFLAAKTLAERLPSACR